MEKSTKMCWDAVPLISIKRLVAGRKLILINSKGTDYACPSMTESGL